MLRRSTRQRYSFRAAACAIGLFVADLPTAIAESAIGVFKRASPSVIVIKTVDGNKKQKQGSGVVFISTPGLF